ncbi:LPXTG cell wall anchor domain-containing protein [Streptomyces sp. CC77]|uniref:LPXTG cell wall anchor domain-containing protein n=1 Tax=Streptomyces sp. CC77 TaxID=1906739 RepID=UPI0008DDE4A5|nr:LPXTG cell wall anchor domain-containing protein [Streptomyces sp. CC77]OII70216.1 hypothetical protein BJP39_14445 [Streptomyces sp. CC77]
MRLSTTTGALVAAAACSLLLAPAAHATNASDPYEVPFHHAKDLPITATSWEGSKEASCADVPADQDGWHFVLPKKAYSFVKLTVEFKEGGEQVLETFAPEAGKHAYVGSAAGDTLLSATAEAKGLDKKGKKAAKFNLSHVCPATEEPEPSGSPDPSGSPEPSGSPDPSPSVSESTDPSPSVSESTDPSESPATEPTPSASESMPEETASSAAPAPSESSATGDLAETGSSAPVGALAGVAAALVAGGAFLVMRRRKGAQQH